jgi:uncharacterized protein
MVIVSRSRGKWTRSLPLEDERLTIRTPCRLGVLADTHASGGRAAMLDPVIDFFSRSEVDLLLHAGDVGQVSLLDRLRQIAPVAAVRGNADPLDLIEALPDRVWIDAGNRQLLLIHGHHGKTALTMARSLVADDVDLIVFGHSHKPLMERQGTTILFNPGSATERRWNPHFGIGLISVSDEGIEPDLILFEDPQHLLTMQP